MEEVAHIQILAGATAAADLIACLDIGASPATEPLLGFLLRSTGIVLSDPNWPQPRPAISREMGYGGSMDRITMEPGQRSNARIRGTPITVWDVYRALSLPGMTDSEVLSKYPELEPDDLAAVREFAAKSIESRTHDEFTGRPILPRDRLVHGRYYKGRCRNATIARWNADENCFYHWREKFGRIYIETIKYPTDVVEPWWDVFDVVEELPGCRFEIPFDAEAAFAGNREDLYEHAEEMWHKPHPA